MQTLTAFKSYYTQDRYKWLHYLPEYIGLHYIHSLKQRVCLFGKVGCSDLIINNI